MKSVCALFAITLCAFITSPGHGSDWPMWRHDAARSAATDHSLPEELHLRWTWKLGRTTPAWPASQTKLQFDAGFEPVCAEGRLIVGSPVDGRVIAVDVSSGELAWTYFTEGPVRFAPAIHKGRVYVVSDDGYLHCVTMEDGSRLWRVNGGPSRRRIIGNDRLVSMWPARGGAVVHDDVAYFSAGIWPSMGVFVRAVDARSGDVLWTNSTTGSRFITHPHGADSFGSISPQGYLAISGDTLLVPGGRTLPAGFDLKTGELRHFEFGGKGAGGFEVLTGGNWYFVNGNIFRASDGASAGRIPARITSSGRTIGNEGTRIVVTEFGDNVTEKIETDRRGKKQTRLTVQSDRISQFEVEGPSRVVLRAGEHVFAVDDGRIAAYDLQEDAATRKPVWSAIVDGDVWSMMAADDCLFVTTRDGQLSCFAADSGNAAEKPAEFALRSDTPGISQFSAGSTRETVRSLAKHVPEFTMPLPGYAICLGVPELPVLNHLLEKTDLYVVIVERNEDLASRFRTVVADNSQFGLRFCIVTDALMTAGLPDCLASLVVSRSDFDSTNPAAIQELVRTLRPYGGTCCIPLNNRQHADLSASFSEAATDGAVLSRSGNWSVIRREGALPGSGVWSHQYGDASNSVVSTDSRVKPPFGLLWFGGPSNDRVLPRHGHGPSPQVAGGRLFIEGPDMLRCVDVYNGRVWWERDLPGLGEYYNNTSHHAGAGEIGSNYVSLEDAVYVVYGKQLLALDARTGQTTRDFELESGESTIWGSVLVDGDVVFASANPVAVTGASDNTKVALPDHSQTLVPRNAEWSYLAGEDPQTEWAALDFDASGWKTGKAGFGYGDNDDRTVLKDMSGKYQRVYIRREFQVDKGIQTGIPTLAINFDDAFIAYLNGQEIHRVNVTSGSGAAAKSVGSHEAGAPEVITLPDALKWLKPGRNVLAIEGHNTSLSSSDFTLDPWLVLVPQDKTAIPTEPRPRRSLVESLESTQYSSASRLLVAFDRSSGRQLWSRTAEFNFRHNALCAANGRLYCIDALSSEKLAVLKRRGIEPHGRSRLMAIDASTGRELWSTREDVFGTFLSYSREHDVLLEAGSAYRDRAKDEVKQGMVAYDGKTGDVVWKDLALGYGGPCLLRHDRIITNGGGGFELELLSGKRTGWSYQRMYGCNTAIGSEHLLTFRSGAAGFCDLFSDSGTGNLGGFRSSCTSNLVVADGVLNAPDYTRTCSCAYQLQTSLALTHDPHNEFWTFGHTDFTSRPVSSLGVNLGAPGDRRDDEGVLWFEYPVVGGPSPKLDVEIEPQSVSRFQQHSSLMSRDPLRWIGASGVRGARTIRLKAPLPGDPQKVSLRLVFAEPDRRKPGERIFAVNINGRQAIAGLDIAAEADGPDRTVIRDIHDVEFDGSLELQLDPKAGSEEPVISGIAIRLP